ncbi:putative quinol monooxygenase [Nocardiopsis deserti]|uniref:putative quinol monooxygenase n=1 Tax=Nocardiopsis deserti TaxID=2605988 RepID=UPI00123BAEB1|nr:antibiotic biosynthesis monooxygenase [Nocardiopsis deserti]
MLIVAGSGRTDPERRAELLRWFETEIRRARTEPGCLDYVVSADPVAPDRVNVFERWESEEELAAHLAAMPPIPDDVGPFRSVLVERFVVVSSAPMATAE